jgi:hypothetical protein
MILLRRSEARIRAADPQTANNIVLVAERYWACLRQGNVDGVLSLLSGPLLTRVVADLAGGDVAALRITLAGQIARLPPATVVVSNIRMLGEMSARADLWIGDHPGAPMMVIVFVNEDERWRIDRIIDPFSGRSLPIVPYFLTSESPPKG